MYKKNLKQVYISNTIKKINNSYEARTTLSLESFSKKALFHLWVKKEFSDSELGTIDLMKDDLNQVSFPFHILVTPLIIFAIINQNMTDLLSSKVIISVSLIFMFFFILPLLITYIVKPHIKVTQDSIKYIAWNKIRKEIKWRDCIFGHFKVMKTRSKGTTKISNRYLILTTKSGEEEIMELSSIDMLKIRAFGLLVYQCINK